MSRRVQLTIAVFLAALLAAGPAAASGDRSARPSPGADPAALAGARLADDADGRVTVDRAAGGRVTFAGVAADARVDNPAVRPTTSVASAAAAHLDRYGAAFGTEQAGTELVQTATVRAVTGHDLVRFGQRVGGLPVIGGDLVVNLRPDRELGSILATLSTAGKVSAAGVTESSAAGTARAAAARQGRAADLRVTAEGRWLFDPAVFGADTGLGARSVWRFEVGNGVEVRRLVLVDDQNGRIILDLDLIATIDRVVCDNANTPVSSESLCTSGFARTEASGPSGVSDVNFAFDLSGAVSDYYDQVGDIDLTEALGINVGGVKKLASTVRFCFSGAPCPYSNAFWNGAQMYYGAGFANADDVVGHEMTHGIIDQHSELFYWFQSGAINESLADIMGEIVDHRHTLVAGDANWLLGEDLGIGAIRNMKNPPAFDDPDKMTSSNYVNDEPSYSDNGGVHSNSGVGNKTAYLISQGGTFNGQTITGIDGADTGLTKTAKLYLAVIQGLTSGSDYADLARVLDQSCQDFVGTAGFTANDCANVHKATLATELTTTPTDASQPADAREKCPTDSVKRDLFDSETGTPAAKFNAASTWIRAPGLVREPGTTSDYPIPSNATSGRASWFALDAFSKQTKKLKMSSAVALPARQRSYLWFQHWRLLDNSQGTYFDGGTVEIDDVGMAGGAVNAAGLPWRNGPKQVLATPNAGRKAFGGDSRGYVASRVELSSYAGKQIKAQFTMRTDEFVGWYGWFVDDVRIYTCDPTVITGKTPKITGKTKVGKRLTAKPGAWSPAGVSFKYKWFRGSKAISGATGKTYRLKKADRGKRIKVRVKGLKTDFATVTKTSRLTRRIA